MSATPPPAVPPPPEPDFGAAGSRAPVQWGQEAQPGAAFGAGPAVGAAPAQPSKWRIYLILGAIVVFVGLVLWVVRNSVTVDDLAVGTCFDVPARESGISTVTRHDCTAAHDAEVIHVADYTGDTYPVSIALDSFIESACVPAFASYVGESLDASADLDIGFFYPSRDGWESGDRTITCYAARIDEVKLTRSIKGSGGS